MQNVRGMIQGEPEMMARRPAPMPQTLPNIPRGIGSIPNIPGLQNIDFSNLPMGMDFTKFDPRAINANPQGFQDMIERARAQEGLQGSLGGPMEFGEARKKAIMTGTRMPNPADYDMSALGPRSSESPSGSTMEMKDISVGTMGGPGYGEYPLGTAGPRVDPSDPNYIPPPAPKSYTDVDGNLRFGDMPITTMPVGDPVPFVPPVQTTAPAQQPLAPYTGGNDPAPYVSNQLRNETGLDALSQQLLFGLDGKGGFIPGAMRAAERSFFNPDGTPRVVEQKVADLTPDQLRAMEMAREATGIQDQYLDDAQSAFRSSVGELGTGLDRARQRELESLGVIQSGVGSLGRQLSDVENIQRGAVGNFGTQLGSLAGRSMGATDQFGNRLGESEGLLRGTLGGYDPSLTSSFYNPFEERVVQQTIDDVLEAGEKQDMAQRARDIMTGGESAFGSRARLSADERREALGRGLGQALGSLRSQGFSEAQRTGLGEFARQRAQEMATAQGLSGLAGSRLGAQQNLTSQLSNFAGQQLGAQQGLASNLGALAGTRFGAQQTQAGALSNLGNLEGQIGQQRAQAQQNLGTNLQNIGQQAQQASAFDINQLMGAGQAQQAQQQAQLDATRMNQLQAQQAPMAQYQSLLPFVQSVPTGSFQTSTTFAPKPSALQSGLGVGLSTLGALGNFFNQPQQRSNAGYTS